MSSLFGDSDDDNLWTPVPSSGAGVGAGAASGAGAGAGETAGAGAAATPDEPCGLDSEAVRAQMAEIRPLDPPEEDVQLKEFALTTLGYIVDSIGDVIADDPEGMAPAMAEVADILCSLPGRSLFADWAPPRGPHEERVDIKKGNVVADSSNPTNPPWNAVDGTSASYWRTTSDSSRKRSKWTAKLGDKPQPVTSVTVTWYKDTTGKFYMPKSYDVQVSAAAKPGSVSWLTVSHVEVPVPVSAASLTHRVGLGGLDITHVRLLSHGNCSGNSGEHRVTAIDICRLDHRVHRRTSATLQDLQSLFCTPAALAAPVIRDEAIRGLMGLMKSSGSLSTLLQLVNCLLAWPQPTLTSAVSQCGAGLVAELGLHVDESIESALSDDVDMMAERSSATFDARTASSGVVLSDGNTHFNSGASSSQRFCFVKPGVSSGNASWVFKVLYDNNSSGLAFGLGTNPSSPPSSYSSSSALWTLDLHSGNVNNGGTRSISSHRVKAGDEARFELDHSAHTVELYVNDVSKGVVFSNLPDKELFPCVCAFGSNRTVKLVNFRMEARFPAGTVLLNDVDESDAGGSFSKDGRFHDGSVLMVNGTDCGRRSVALVPSRLSGSFARYELGEEPAECFVGKVAIADASSTPAIPVVLEVRLDDSLVWTSEPMSTPGTSRFFRVFMSKNTSIELRTRALCDGCDASAAVARMVVVNPRILPPRDWSWVPNGRANVAVSEVSQVSTPMQLVSHIASMAASLGAIALKQARAKELEVPFCCLVNGDTLSLLGSILEQLGNRVRSASASAQDARVLSNLLQLLRLNLTRLTGSGVAPVALGITLDAGGDQQRTLAGIHKLLNEITHEDSAYPAEVQVAAATAVDAGLTLFYPSAEERRALLTSLVSAGGVVEVQFKFPTLRPLAPDETAALDEDRGDLRFERVLLMLQVECEAMGWNCQLEGAWGAFSHLIIDIPHHDPRAATEFLDSGFARIFKKAGFPEWTFPTGCADPNISLVIQRFMGFQLHERAFTEDGIGFVRLYPCHAGSFDDVTAGVRKFLDAYAAQQQAATTVADAGADDD